MGQAENPLEYAQLAVQLRAMAQLSKDPEAQGELHALAARYERLATLASDLSEKYLPMTDSPLPRPSHRD